MLRDIVNNQLIPRMAKHGFPVKGMRFEWDDSVDYTPEQQKAYEEMVLANYEVDGKYFEEKYGMPVGERRQQAVPALPGKEPEDDGNGTKDGEKKAKNMRPSRFFD